MHPKSIINSDTFSENVVIGKGLDIKPWGPRILPSNSRCQVSSMPLYSMVRIHRCTFTPNSPWLQFQGNSEWAVPSPEYTNLLSFRVICLQEVCLTTYPRKGVQYRQELSFQNRILEILNILCQKPSGPYTLFWNKQIDSSECHHLSTNSPGVLLLNSVCERDKAVFILC